MLLWGLLIHLEIRNYSPEVSNIQRREAELNIISLRVNNFDIKQKRHGIFVLSYTTNKIHHISVIAQVFFGKTELQHIQLQLLINHFILLWFIFFFQKSLTHEKINRIRIFLTWNWQLIWDCCEIKQENMIHLYDAIIIDVTGVQ